MSKPPSSKEYKKMLLSTLEDIVKKADAEADADAQTESSTQPKKKVKIITSKKRSGSDFNNPELKYYDPNEKTFYNKLAEDQKRLVADLEARIKDMNEEDVPLRFKILLSNIDDKVKAIAIKKLKYVYDMDESSAEHYKVSNWIESLCRVPIGKYKNLPITKSSSIEDIRDFIKGVKQTLDDTVYGHTEAKDHIIRLIAQWISNPESKGLVIGIHGAAGLGKTSLVKNGICKALGLPFAFLALGGASDGAFLDGHSYTYEGSTWGRIVDILMKARYMNPVLYFDELDKVSLTYKGDEITNILIHLTDSTQNDKFQDKYFSDIDFDLSRCLIIFSYNDESVISPILKDRMVKIKTDGYKTDEKIVIAQQYLIPELLDQFKLNEKDIIITKETLRYMIVNRVEDEQGVRNLKRGLECILSNLNLNLLLSPEEVKLPITIDEVVINKYIKKQIESRSHAAMYT
jgi:ATP-dependent Lon protease